MPHDEDHPASQPQPSLRFVPRDELGELGEVPALGRREFFGLCALRLVQIAGASVLIGSVRGSAYGMVLNNCTASPNYCTQTKNTCPPGGKANTCGPAPPGGNFCQGGTGGQTGNCCQAGSINPANDCTGASTGATNECTYSQGNVCGAGQKANTCQKGATNKCNAGGNTCDQSSGDPGNACVNKGKNVCISPNNCNANSNTCSPATANIIREPGDPE